MSKYKCNKILLNLKNHKSFFFYITVFIIGFILFFFIFILKIKPAEDGAILFRYAEIFAKHNKIAYNIDGLPTNGATEFLYMIILGLISKIGLSVIWANYILCIILILILFLLFYKEIKTIAGPFFAIIFTIFLLTTPILFLNLIGFGLLVTCLLITISMIAHFKYIYITKNQKYYLLIGLFFSILIPLQRPEMSVFTIGLIISFLYYDIKKKSFLTNIHIYAICLIIPIIYLIWSFLYFGDILPTTFYIKESAHNFHLGNFSPFAFFVISIIILLFLLYKNEATKNQTNNKILLIFTIINLIFIGFFTLYQNVMYRFTLPFVIVICLIYIFSQSLIKRPNKSIYIIKWVFVSLLLVTSIFYLTKQYKYLNYINDHRVYIGQSFNKLGTKYTLLTTEAGNVPFFSKWTAYDAFGLNDIYIAHKRDKFIDDNYIKQINPDVIYMHISQFPMSKTWLRLNKKLFDYANTNNYKCAGILYDFTGYYIYFTKSKLHKKVKEIVKKASEKYNLNYFYDCNIISRFTFIH